MFRQGNYPLPMKKKILIVEDDISIQDALELILEMNGYSTSRAVTKEQVLQIVKDQKISLILMDYLLGGGVTGIDIAHAIPIKKKIPVVLLSASYRLEQLAKEEDRIEDYLPKPFELDELLTTIKKYAG